MNIKKTIIFTGLSLLLSSTFNSACSSHTVEESNGCGAGGGASSSASSAGKTPGDAHLKPSSAVITDVHKELKHTLLLRAVKEGNVEMMGTLLANGVSIIDMPRNLWAELLLTENPSILIRLVDRESDLHPLGESAFGMTSDSICLIIDIMPNESQRLEYLKKLRACGFLLSIDLFKEEKVRVAYIAQHKNIETPEDERITGKGDVPDKIWLLSEEEKQALLLQKWHVYKNEEVQNSAKELSQLGVLDFFEKFGVEFSDYTAPLKVRKDLGIDLK